MIEWSGRAGLDAGGMASQQQYLVSLATVRLVCGRIKELSLCQAAMFS